MPPLHKLDNKGGTQWPPVAPKRSDYGRMRYSIRGNGIVSRMCSMPHIHAVQRSIPIPKPPCGMPPYRRKSRYHSNASSLRKLV